MQPTSNLMDKIVDIIIDPALLVIFALGFFLFVYGLVEFLWKINEGGHTDEGKQHMFWGIIGMLIMISVYGILSLIDNTFGLDFSNPDVGRANNITVPNNFFGR